MKILAVITPVSYGGGENQLVLLARELKKYNLQIKVLNLTKSEEFENVLKKEGVEYYNLTNIKIGFGLSQRGYLKLFFKLIPYIIFIREPVFKDADIVWAHGFPANASVFLMNRMGILGKNKKFLYSHHFIKSPMTGISKLVYEKILDSFDLIIGVSSKTSNSLSEVFPKLRNKIITVPNAVDFRRFDIAESKAYLRDKLGLPLEDILGIFVARFVAFKNHIFLLEVLKK